MANCTLCPRRCGANRENGELGVCGAPAEIKVALAQLHMWEEPPITGEKGSGTIFFSHCPLKCTYCQNSTISSGGKGGVVTIEELQNMMLRLQNDGAENINFVTGTQWAPEIVQAVKGIKQSLKIPIVWNTSSYENPETIELLNGIVDIYLADFKYHSNTLAQKLSSAPNYRQTATEAISTMLNGQSEPENFAENLLNSQSEPEDLHERAPFGEAIQAPRIADGNFSEHLLNGQSEPEDLHERAPFGEAIRTPRLGSKRSVIIRHLVLPGHTDDSKKVIKHVNDCFGNKVTLSIMNQFTPINKISEFPELNRTLTKEEYEEVLDFADSIGISDYFWQEGETCKESFIPNF